MKRQVTILPADKTILVDGVARKIAFSVSSGIRALQWFGASGHVEYKDGSHRHLSLALYDSLIAPLLALWETASEIDDVEAKVGNFEVFLQVKQQEIRDRADAAVKEARSRYSLCEENTWAMQEAGARIVCDSEKYTKNTLAAFILGQEGLRHEGVALVEVLAAERGVDIQTLAEAIVLKADRLAAYETLVFEEQRQFSNALKKLAEGGGEARGEEILQEFKVAFTSYDCFMLMKARASADTDSL